MAAGLPDSGIPARPQAPWTLVVLATSGLLITACMPPIPSGGFEGPDPASRIYAAVDVAATYERTGVRPDRGTLEHLVVMLGSTDPAARFVASDTLRMVTNTNLGYQPSAPLPERAQAVQRWRDWVAALSDPNAEGRS